MSKTFDFESLVELCRQTHEAMQGRAARVADSARLFAGRHNWSDSV